MITSHDILEPLIKQVLLASRDVMLSGQICGSRLQRVLTLGDGCWLPKMITLVWTPMGLSGPSLAKENRRIAESAEKGSYKTPYAAPHLWQPAEKIRSSRCLRHAAVERPMDSTDDGWRCCSCLVCSRSQSWSEEFQKPQPLLVSKKVLQHTSKLYASILPIYIAVPSWLLSLERETQQYTSHL